MSAKIPISEPGFFDEMGARIVDGRSFGQGDVVADGGVAVVDREWAGETFGGRSAVGRRIRYPPAAPGEEAGGNGF